MICCVLLLLVVGAARAVLLTLLPGRSRREPVPFPPAARRTVGSDAHTSAHPSPVRVTAPPAAAHSAWRAPTGTALVVVGTVWFATGILAMHVLGIVPASIDSVPWRDVAFHLSGPLVASAGLVLRAPARGGHRRQHAAQVKTGAAL